MSNSLQEARRLGQSIWYDNLRRGLLVSGELRRLVEEGVTGLTSNPAIFEAAIARSADYDAALLPLALAGKEAPDIYEELALEDIRATADLLRPVYEETEGRDGFASLEVSPLLANDTLATVAEAHRLFEALNRPNVLIKVPATPAGIPAIRQLIGHGVNVNITLIFSLEMYRQVRDAYLSGLEDLDLKGGDLGRVASVASFFLSRVDTAVDSLLDASIKEGETELESLKGKAAIANAKLAYQAFKTTFNTARFEQLRQRGARVQRPLWASTSAKNPAYSDVMYVEPLIGPDTVNTMPQVTLTAFLEHGRATVTIEDGLAEAQEVLARLDAAGISMKEVTDKLLADGVKAFADPFEKLMAHISEKRARFIENPAQALTRDNRLRPASHTPQIDRALAEFSQNDGAVRLWRKDHTLWQPDPTEISDRLGWLDVGGEMRRRVPDLEAFAAEIKAAGFRHAVLLGMGGSSLGAEALRQVFGSAPGFPEMLVLDTTVPAAIQAATRQIDPAHTLFLVSSKSGGTAETMSLYRHFRRLVADAVGEERAGSHFVAITDPNTSLAQRGEAEGFRRVFLNPPDIGGRYSILSYFGLVPAALLGIDLGLLLERAEAMKSRCLPGTPARDNPGVWLGGALGEFAKRGRDKATLVASPALSSFGLWAEQLLAESTGKEEKGIIPVAGEPLADPDSYGSDRVFVHLRLTGDDNAEADAALDRLAQAGRPIIQLDLADRYDLGGEFFRWEFATATAGALLGLNPFDQPDVQASKDNTEKALAALSLAGASTASSGDAAGLLAQARPGDYAAVLAYLPQTPEIDALLGELRRKVLTLGKVATTQGYGPRYLHSTGQLHKGGPNTGLFLVLTADAPEDLPIPGQGYGFAALAAAQAAGDLTTLQERGRRAVRVHLGADPAAGLRQLMETLA